MDKLISIIVPIYNGEKYLEKCLESLLKQTYKKIEILLINDGSKDNSMDICKIYKKKDNRIKIINKENEGVAVARNLGIEVAKGDFITFVDCDDYLDKSFCERMIDILLKTDADFVACNFKEICLNGIKSPDLFSYIDKDELIMDKYTSLKAAIEKKSFATIVWGKIFKKSVIKDIRFPKQKFAEDSAFVHDVIVNSNIIYITTYEGYYYVRNPESTTIRNQSFSRVFDSMKTSKRLLEECKKYCPELKYNAMSQLASYIYGAFCEMCKNNITEKIYIDEILKYLDEIELTKIKCRNKEKIILLNIKKVPGFSKKILKVLYSIKNWII